MNGFNRTSILAAALASAPLFHSFFTSPAKADCGAACAPSATVEASALQRFLPLCAWTGTCVDGAAPACVRARRLWSEDFESGTYERWANATYDDAWGNHCQSNRFDDENAFSGSRSHRSEITCPSPDSVHRGYGGVQFDGDTALPAYTNAGVGIDAPHGVVNTFWTWLDTPYDFANGRWLSLWTANSDCGWNERVVTIGFEDTTWRLTPAHIWDTGGQVTFDPNAPAFPRRQWVRTTVYVNYHRGEMHVWQDGQSVFHATFSRPTNDICQWHWGAYSSGDNTNVVLYEDDNSIWKLEQDWTDFSVEPWFEGTTNACE